MNQPLEIVVRKGTIHVKVFLRKAYDSIQKNALQKIGGKEEGYGHVSIMECG
jgi:hypothetical protein